MATPRAQAPAERTSDPSSFLPLTPVSMHILVALADRELHGYAIMKRIHRDSSGLIKLGPGTLYRTIQRLQANGLIEVVGEGRNDPDALDDARRIYYRLTDLGRRVHDAEVARLDALTDTAKMRRLNPVTAG